MEKVLDLIKQAKFITAFTGAGISVESGIPCFRGKGGLWEKYDPKYIEIDFFNSHPKESWAEIKKIFYSMTAQSKPNKAHEVLAKMERAGLLKGIVTQNIDNLHQEAGSKIVYEFHGTLSYLTCQVCGKRYKVSEVNLNEDLPSCPSCKGLLKPDFVFYGEGIPPTVYQDSVTLAQQSDLMIVVGTSGEVMPACALPHLVKQNGGKIIEVNTLPSAYTNTITDLYFEEKASEFFGKLESALNL